jgi:hypothetical protein
LFSGGPHRERFHEGVAAIDAIALRLSALIPLLAAMFVFVRQALEQKTYISPPRSLFFSGPAAQDGAAIDCN